MNRHWSLRQVDAAGVAAILGITALSYVLALRPAVAARRERTEMAQRLEAETLANRTVAARVNEMQTTLREEREGMAAYPIRLTTMPSMNDRISDVVDLARECGLQVRSTEPGQLERATIYGVVGVRLEGKGGYRACVQFLHRLNTDFSDMGVRSISLISQPQSPYSEPFFNLQLLWFVQLAQPGA